MQLVLRRRPGREVHVQWTPPRRGQASTRDDSTPWLAQDWLARTQGENEKWLNTRRRCKGVYPGFYKFELGSATPLASPSLCRDSHPLTNACPPPNKHSRPSPLSGPTPLLFHRFTSNAAHFHRLFLPNRLRNPSHLVHALSAHSRYCTYLNFSSQFSVFISHHPRVLIVSMFVTQTPSRRLSESS